MATNIEDLSRADVEIEGELIDGQAVIVIVERCVGVGAIVDADGEVADIHGVTVGDSGDKFEVNGMITGPGGRATVERTRDVVIGWHRGRVRGRRSQGEGRRDGLGSS